MRGITSSFAICNPSSRHSTKKMRIDTIGEFTYDREFDWHYGSEESADEPIGEFQLVLEGYLDEEKKEDFKTAMVAF